MSREPSSAANVQRAAGHSPFGVEPRPEPPKPKPKFMRVRVEPSKPKQQPQPARGEFNPRRRRVMKALVPTEAEAALIREVRARPSEPVAAVLAQSLRRSATKKRWQDMTESELSTFEAHRFSANGRKYLVVGTGHLPKLPDGAYDR